jgi:sugar diacid utilization regulator
VALKNAREFERANAALARADLARDELERHVRSIQAAADAHERMTSLLARGAALPALCETVAELLQGAVLVLDEAAQVVGRAGAPGGAPSGADAYAPHGPHSAAIAAALGRGRAAGRSVVAYEEGGETCRIMPVFGGGELLGALALYHRGRLEEAAVRTFERSGSVIGVVLLSQERMEAARSRGVASLLRALVAPRPGELSRLAESAARHGLDLAQPVVLLLVQAETPGAAYAARQLRELPALAGTLVDEIDGNVVLLCAAARAGAVRQAVGTGARQQFGAAHRGVVSRPADCAQIPALYATLSRALPVLARLGVQGELLAQNELALYSALFETHDRSSLAGFLEATLGPVLAHDRKRHSGLATSLLTYFDCNQNARTTAQRLGIHVNTVRQRLATIESLLGPWSAAARALEIHIALRLWALGTPAVQTGAALPALSPPVPGPG